MTMIRVNKLLLGIFLFCLLAMPFASALGNLVIRAPLANQGVRGTILVNATTNELATLVNFTFVNSTSGVARYFEITNESDTDLAFENSSFVTSLLSDGVYNLTVNATNGTVSILNTTANITIDNTVPSVVPVYPANSSFFRSTFNVTLNVTDATIGVNSSRVQYRLLNSTFANVTDWLSLTYDSATGYFYASSAVTSFTDGIFIVMMNGTDLVGNVNGSVNRTIIIDDTDPSGTFTCNDVSRGQSASCTCSATDNSESFGGSVQTSITAPSTDSSGGKTATCDITDSAGNSDQLSANFLVINNGGSGGGGGSGGSSGGGSGDADSWTIPSVTVRPGQTTRVAVGAVNTGVTDIVFTTTQIVRAASVEVSSVDDLPSSVEDHTGKQYTVFSIEAPAITTYVAEGTKIRFTVNQSWITANNVAVEDVRLFRYVNGEWRELETRKLSVVGSKIKFEAETPGFSYFLIGTAQDDISVAPSTTPVVPSAPSTTPAPTVTPSEPAVQEETQASAPAQQETTQTSQNQQSAQSATVPKQSSDTGYLVWIGLVVVIVGIVLFFTMRRKHK